MSDIKDLLKSGEAKKLLENKDELSRAAQSEDGKKVMESLEKADIAGAIKRGDTAAVRSAIESITKTKEGARFLRSLSSAIGKKPNG
ncbi:MAG: hypothetical protein IJP67_00475 [Oscillospiraceae bacterium]|nr:hypothetical protein [Oscillospiraceae bacterium]MBR0062621.1 hypothetical protein [Oscillospiraceae bacterium]